MNKIIDLNERRKYRVEAEKAHEAVKRLRDAILNSGGIPDLNRDDIIEELSKVHLKDQTMST